MYVRTQPGSAGPWQVGAVIGLITTATHDRNHCGQAEAGPADSAPDRVAVPGGAALV